MKQLTITSLEHLDSRVADVVKFKIRLAAAKAARDLEVQAVEKRHTRRICEIQDEIKELEADVVEYCNAHRSTLFVDRKSRETPLATYGFELTPFRVEPMNRKIKIREIVDRLLRLTPWGQQYVRQPEPQLNKEALLADRSTLTPERLGAAGIAFVQDEQFFIRPKPETAEDSVSSAAA